MNCGGRLESSQTAKGHCLTVCEQIMILNPTKPSCICLFLLVCTVRRVLTEQGRSKIQYFTLFRTLSCLTSFTTVQETFFPLLTTTSLLLSLRHSKLLSSLFRQPLCLLICSLRFCSKKGLTKMPFKFFFLGQNSYGAKIGPISPGQTFLMSSS